MKLFLLFCLCVFSLFIVYSYSLSMEPKHKWIQNNHSIQITIYNIYGINKHIIKHFIQITPIYFSLNFSPYLFQIDFENEIDPFYIKVIIKNNKEIKFIFPKKIKNKKWNNLNSDKSKEIRLKLRKESMDKLYKKQQEIDEKRKKKKRLRFKAAQQRQWDEEKYLKSVINKLENKEKQKSRFELENWLKQKKNNHDKNKFINDNLAEIRPSNTIEIGFSEWDYITPIRQNTKPPQFASKTLINNQCNKNKQCNKNISEQTSIFLCDKGIKYFINKDYKSAINVFNEAINLENDHYTLKLLNCNKIQCLIQDQLLNIKNININNYNLINIDDNDNDHDIKNMIILLQKGIIQTFIVFDKLNYKQIIDDEILSKIIKLFEKGHKLFKFYNKNNNLINNFGLFENIEIIKDLYILSEQYKNIINLIKHKKSADKKIKNKKNYINAINDYTQIINNGYDQNYNFYLNILKYQCLCNRSSAYFLRKEFLKCIDDCTQIINNYKLYINYKIYAKRGASYLSLWKFKQNNKHYLIQSLNDYKNASKYNQIYTSNVLKLERLCLCSN